MNADELTADDALPPGFTVDGPDGRPVEVRAFWERSDVLHHVRREADERRRLFGDAAEAAGDLEEDR